MPPLHAFFPSMLLYDMLTKIVLFFQAGPVASNSFTKQIPDALQSNFQQTVDEKNVLVIDKEDCTMSNLCSLIDSKDDHFPGNNSFVN